MIFDTEAARSAHPEEFGEILDEACDEIERLRTQLGIAAVALGRIADQPTKIFPGNVTAYVPNYVHQMATEALLRMREEQ